MNPLNQSRKKYNTAAVKSALSDQAISLSVGQFACIPELSLGLDN
jgi:hypothetical protein